MPQEGPKPERSPKRDTLDRLLARLPILARSAPRVVVRLRPGSPLRKRLVRFQAERAFAAMARSDVEMLLLYYESDAEVWMRSMSGVGFSECYRGHEGIRRLYADLDEAFEDWQWTVRTVADGGDRLAFRTDFAGYGRGSGARTTVKDGGMAVKLSTRGLVAWQEWFAERDGWKAALEVAGLSE